jgi:hypothetical protein
VVVGCVAVLATLAGCGGDAAQTAEALIEGPLTDEIALGELTATCDQPANLEQGETFECTATTPDGDTIELVGELTSDDDLNVQTTNLLTADDVELILSAIADAVAVEVDADVVAGDITCPPRSVILDARGDFVCEIVDRSTDDVYPITIETGGLDPDSGPMDLSFLIGDLIDR